MAKQTKRQKALPQVDSTKLYALDEALTLIKSAANAKFDESIDVAVQLGVDAKKSDQVVRGAVVMPNGTGKTKRVAVFAQGAKAEEAKAAAAGSNQNESDPEKPAYAGEGAYAGVRELDALLHFLTAHPERRLDEDGGSIRVEGLGSVAVDAGSPVDLRVYAPDGKYEWEEHTKRLREHYPLVVFSKTFCPYVPN